MNFLLGFFTHEDALYLIYQNDLLQGWDVA